MVDLSKGKALSGAEITETIPHERDRFHQLMKFAEKGVRPSGKKGDLINGVAAFQAEQFRIFERLGHFHLDKPTLDDDTGKGGQDVMDDTWNNSQDTQIVERDISSSPSGTTRQFTIALSVSQEETKTLAPLSGLAMPAITPCQQSTIVNFSSIPRTLSKGTPIKQRPLKATFLDNIDPPFFHSPLPGPNKQFHSTRQLAFGRHLLLTKKMLLRSLSSDSQVTVEDGRLVMGLEETDRVWIRAIMKDTIEQDRLCWLTTQVVSQFLKSNHKDAQSIAEVILLGSVLDRQDFRRVLSSLFQQLEQGPLLDPELLKGIMYFLQSALPGHLIDDDLVRILRVLRKRLEETHIKFDNTKKLTSAHVYLLTMAVSRVVDMMVEGNVHGLNRTEDQRPLLSLFAGLRDSADFYLNNQATYVCQALQYIGDDESPLNMTLRVGSGLVMAGLGVASVFRLDIGGLFNGLRELGNAAGQVLDATNALFDSIQIARNAGEGIINSVLKGFQNGEKRAWYPALQGARVFIREGRVADFKRLVYEAPCCREIEFQWCICQLLGEMAMDLIWGTEIRQQAIYLLEDLYNSDSGWIEDSSVRVAICGILLCIHQNAEKILSVSVDALSLSRKWDNGSKGVEPYPLISRLLTPESSPLLARALMVPSSEYKLHRMMAQRFEALQQQVYIPPHAKANLKALDDEYFPLMDKVLEFLASDRQVFLILGNSGSGKSTFIKHVSSVLMKDYDQGSPIPLFIYLPDIKNSSTGLISEQLQILGFTEDDIQELKRDRLFVIFCDSYDESQLSINLHTSNMLNHPGQWNAKMIISCRSTHARRDYLDRFQPQSLDRYGPPTPHLFQEAVIVPFSSSQIKDYVDQFVQHKVIDKLLSIPVIWSASEYMDKLTRIPNLLQLVTNPFLLKLALKSLPVVFKNDNCDPSTVTITRPKLFGMFIEDWLEVNRKRLISMELSKEARAKLDELIDGDFKTIAINFLQDLAKDIYEKQAGHSVVQYIHRVDKGSWKSKFFGPDEETTLLRQSSPLTCVENLHSFIHRSLLEYFRSLQMTRLVVSPNNGWENGLSSSGSSDPGKISFYPGGPLANQPTKNHRSGLGVQSIHENPRLSMGHGPPNYAPVTPSLPPSTTTTPHRKTDQGAMNSIEATVKKFLVPVKQLQEGLTLWSTQKMTAAQILDIFVQLTTQFNLVSKSFHEVGIDTSELAPIVDDLRGCLETALGEAPSPASLHLYLSRIKEVIINLLQGISLKKNVYREQYKARTARTQGTSATTPTPTTSLPLPATTATTTTPSTISPSIRRVRTSVSAGQQLHQQQHVQQQQQLQKRQQRPSHSAPSRSYTQQLQQRYFQGHQVAQLTSTSSFPSSPAWPANMNGGTPEMEMPSLDYSNGSSAAPSCFPPHLQKLQEIEQSPHMTPPSPSLSSPQYGDLSGLSDDFFVASVLNIIPTNMPPIAHFDYLSEFRQRQRIATGGNGEIRRAFWPLHQTFVILKSLIDTEHKTEKIIKLFDKEVEVMSQCKQHDNIAQFYGIAIRNSDDDREGDRFMIMQYYELGNLTKLLEKPKNLPEAPTLTDKLYLAMDIAVGLDHLLKCGYHHGDLHPKNILIDLRPNAQPNQGRYRARLTDFGLQRIRDNKNQASSKQFGGVWQFMAPERMSKHRPRYDIRCDIFALGVLYWFILAGRYPFKDPSNFSPGMREGRIDGTPEWFYQIYTKAWSEDPDDRQQTFEEIARSFWYNLRIPLASSQVVETLRKSDAITHRASSRRHSQQFLTLLEQNPPLVPQRRPILDLNILDPGGCALTLEEEGEVRAAPNSGNDWSSTPLATTSSSLSFISNEHELPIAAVDPVVDSSSPAPRDPAKASINDRIQVNPHNRLRSPSLDTLISSETPLRRRVQTVHTVESEQPTVSDFQVQEQYGFEPARPIINQNFAQQYTTRHVQQIRLGSIVKRVLAKERNGMIVVMLQDVQDIFEGARRLECNRISLPFVTDENQNRLIPLRVEYHRDRIYDVILGQSVPDQRSFVTAPISIPSPLPSAQTTPSSSLTNDTLLKPISSPPGSVPPQILVAPLIISRTTLPVVQEEDGVEPNIKNAESTTTSASLSYVSNEHEQPTTTPGEDRTQVNPHNRLRSSNLNISPSTETPLRRTVQTVHTMPINFSLESPVEPEQASVPNAMLNEQHGFEPEQIALTKAPVQEQYDFEPAAEPVVYQNPPQLPYVPNTVCPSRPFSKQNPNIFNQHYNNSSQYQPQLHHQHPSRSNRQDQWQARPWELSNQVVTTMAPAVPRKNPRRGGITTQPVAAPTSVPAPKVRRSNTNDPHGLDPNGIAIYGQSPPSHRPLHGFLTDSHHPLLDSGGANNNTNSQEGLIKSPRSAQPDNDNIVRDLQVQLRKEQIRNHRMTQVQNKVQSVLTQNHELHENSAPRLFLVLPTMSSEPEGQETAALAKRTSTLSTSSSYPSTSTIASGNGPRTFRVHFLCECGQYTRPLQSSGLNHIHFVDHEGYELVRSKEFFDKYGEFIRTLSHLIRNGVNCGMVSINALLANNMAVQPQLQPHPRNANNFYRAYAVGQEQQKNRNLDARLAEMIDYLDSLENDLDLETLENKLNSGVDFLDGTDIQQLLTYIRLPPHEISSIGGLYRIMTSRGFAKWVCEEHHRSTIHQQNELDFQREIRDLGGQYDVKTGRARIRLSSDKDAGQLYKIMTKAHNLHELDIALKWSFNESDIQRFVQAITESKIGVLSLDGCQLKGKTTLSSSEGFLKSKKYDPLYKILFSSKIQSLRLVNLPSLLPNISVNHPIAGASTFSVRILQLENVGALDFSGERGGHTSLGVNLSLRNGNSHVHSQSIMRTLLTSFRYLTSIIVPGMNIGDEGVRMITEQQDLHKTLRWINFSDNGISSIGGQLLATCLAREKAIVFLDMGINAIGDDILVMIIEAMGSKLMSLNLESTGFGDKATKALERLVISYFACPDPEPRLKYLNLANSGWTTSALQSLGRTLVRLRLFTPTIVQSSGSRKSDLEMGPGEAFLLVNSMIKTTHINGFSGKEKLWHQRHMILSQYAALTATKESYGPPDLRAQDMIAVNSRIKILRLWNAGLSNGAARYLIGLLDMNILTKLDLRRCVRIFKPPEVVAILTRMLIHTTDDDPQILQAAAAAAKATAQTRPQAPAALSSGLPKNCLRSLLLSSTGVDDQVAEVLAQHLQSGGSSIEKLDVSSNNLTHKGITSLLNALCNNTSIRRLNLGQNFRASHSIDPSSTTASSQMTREALRRMMLENTTLETLYFISADIDIVAKGLNANKTIRSLAFDRLEGTLKGVEAFGRALAVNQTLLRLKVYDGRQPPFLQGFYNCGGSGHYSNSHPQQQHIQYMDPFREFKHEAIKTVEGGLKFNYSLIEVQWPELFDIAQPWTDRLDAILLRNIDILKSEEAETGSDGHTKDGSDSQRLHGGSRTHPGVSSLSRRFSFTSTTCTLLNAPDRSSSSSQSMDPDFGPPMSNHSNNSSIGFIPVSGGGGGGEGYTYSVHSKHSNGGAPPTLDSTAGSSGGGLGRGHVSGLASVDFSDQTANRRRQFPSREQQRQQYQQQQQRKVRMSRHSHVDEPHIFQRMNRHGYIRHGYVGPEPATAAAVTVMFPEETAPRSPKGVPATTPGDIVGCDSQMTTESPSLAGQNDDTSTAVPEPIEPAVSNGSSWFHLATDTGNAAAGALTLVDGVWKRTVQLLTTRRAHVDAVCPIAKTSYVYCDNEVYDAVLTERSTGVTYVIQLLYSSEEHVYYIYVRWGETDFRLEGPHTTIKAAKEAFQVTYSDLFGVQWTERETDVNDAWLYEVKTHETLGETEEIEEVFDETEVSADIALQTEVEQKKEAEVETSTSTTATEEVVVDEENTKEVATTHETELDARTAMSNGTTLQLLEYKISGLPASLGDLTMEGLKSEMKTAPVFDDQMFGALDLEEEPDILVFLVDRVFEDPNYTKLLVWTVYKSGAEGAVSQSTKNAKCILEMAGIQFQPSIQVKVVASPNAVG